MAIVVCEFYAIISAYHISCGDLGELYICGVGEALVLVEDVVYDELQLAPFAQQFHTYACITYYLAIVHLAGTLGKTYVTVVAGIYIHRKSTVEYGSYVAAGLVAHKFVVAAFGYAIDDVRICWIVLQPEV